MTAFICTSNVFAAREINNASVFVSEYNSAGAPEEIFNINANFSFNGESLTQTPPWNKLTLKAINGQKVLSGNNENRGFVFKSREVEFENISLNNFFCYSGNGGAIHSDRSKISFIGDTVFEGNRNNPANAIYSLNSTFSFRNGTVNFRNNGNSNYSYGVTIYATYSSFSFVNSDVRFYGNHEEGLIALYNRSYMSFDKGNITIDNNYYEADDYGGRIDIRQSNLIFSNGNITISNNNLRYGDGAIYLTSQANLSFSAISQNMNILFSNNVGYNNQERDIYINDSNSKITFHANQNRQIKVQNSFHSLGNNSAVIEKTGAGELIFENNTSVKIENTLRIEAGTVKMLATDPTIY
jgi:hypothetical protein